MFCKIRTCSTQGVIVPRLVDDAQVAEVFLELVDVRQSVDGLWVDVGKLFLFVADAPFNKERF
jgi:hypothetical protein